MSAMDNPTSAPPMTLEEFGDFAAMEQRAQAAEAELEKVKYELAEARAELDRIYEKDAMDSIERLRKEAK